MRRFIAGAMCPDCGATDTIYIVKGAVPESRHCVECGFSDERPKANSSQPDGIWSPVRLPGDDSSNK